MHRWIRNALIATSAFGLLACSGSAKVDNFNEGGAGGSGATGTGTAGSGGVDCNCAVGAYVPVCGMDGVTYDAACGRQCVPVQTECDGPCPCVDCDDLEVQYTSALAAARSCSPILAFEQCTEEVPDQLACPCTTFINPGNTEAVNQLRRLQGLWNDNGCGDLIDCPAVACVEPGYSFCEPTGGSGDSGACVDEYAVSGDP